MVLLIVSAVVVASVLRFLWRKAKSPSRTSTMVLLDTLCELPALLRVGPWATAPDEEPFKREIAELGDTGAVNRYTVARREGQLRSKARFSPGGHAVLRFSFDKRVEEKKLFKTYFQRHPQIAAMPVKPPIFVIGFTRTGTTFLHEMLGLHEDVRSHYTWEQMAMVPATDSENIKDLARARLARKKETAAMFSFFEKHVLGPQIQYIHRIDYEEPEECTIPCSFELPWSFLYLPLMVYAADKVIPLGAGEAFTHYKKFLQMLAFQAPDRRDQEFTWMLKCPFHLPYLRELAEAFPGCTIVWTHRHPVECFASACSLFHTILTMTVEEDSVSKQAMGTAIMNYSRICLDLAEKALDELQGKINIVHVRYQDNVQNPKVAVKEVLEKSGLPFSETYQQNLDAYLQKNAEKRKQMKEQKNNKETMHEYKPEDFGLSAELINREFKSYIEKYNL